VEAPPGSERGVACCTTDGSREGGRRFRGGRDGDAGDGVSDSSGQDRRRSLGVRERTFLQQTPQGDLVLVTLEGDHPETAFVEFGKRTDPFAMWFKQQVSEIHGMDLSLPPPGPMPQQVIDSHS